jgi:hypothetical protein
MIQFNKGTLDITVVFCHLTHLTRRRVQFFVCLKFMLPLEDQNVDFSTLQLAVIVAVFLYK